LLAVERYKRGRRFKHDLAWVDAREALVHYGRSSGGGVVVDTPAVLKRWVSDTTFRAVAQAPITSVPGLLDRLTLLQQLRQRESTDGRPWTAVLTDGLKQYRYEITSLGLESLAMAEGPRDSLHLRVQGWEMLPDGELAAEPEHPPIDVWLSRDVQGLPLRLRIDHAVGVFSVDLVDAVTLVEVVIEPPPEAAVVASSGVD
jgi:hypothetical protein